MTVATPHHLTLNESQVAGNGGRGRVFLLPGSDGRAQRIAARLTHVEEAPSPRQLNAYLGEFQHDGQTVDVGVVPTGMGCPSVDIVVTELIGLGARRLLRVGTAGSLQPEALPAGSLVIATGAVRDEATSDPYLPRGFPAMAHPDWVDASRRAAVRLGLATRTFAGPVHTKDSLFAREFAAGPRSNANLDYMRVLGEGGVLASEMEAAHLFILAAVHGKDISPVSAVAASPTVVKAGTVLAIIGDHRPFAPPEVAREAEDEAITLALHSAVELLAAEDA